MVSKLISILTILILIGSCKSSKQKFQNDSYTKRKDTLSKLKRDMAHLIEDKLIEEGYQFGMVKELDSSDCPFAIFNETTEVLLDPINFNDSGFSKFKKDSLKIYFKFRPLRMMSRCKDASPIELESIKKRED